MFLALRDLAFAKGRFALMSMIIALVAFLMTLLSGLASGLIKNNISALMALDVTHIAFEYNERPNYRNSMVERDMWEGWRTADGVLAAEPLGHTMFTARRPDNEPLDDVVLWGVEPGSFLEPTVFAGKQLQGPEDGVIISALLANKHAVRLGDVIVLDRVLTKLKVIGISEEQNIAHVPVIYAPMRKWQEATYGPPGGPPPGEVLPDILFDYASVIALKLAPEADIEALDIDEGTVSLDKNSAYAASSGYKEEVQTVQMIQAFMVIISALVIGAFFTIWTIQRTQEIGLVKALGGSSGYLLKDTMGQALIVMFLAVSLGTLVAVWLGLSLEESGKPFMLVRDDILGSSGLLIVAGLVGSMVSVRLITRIDPIIALGRTR
jgi:putative ABC transport system permease protein